MGVEVAKDGEMWNKIVESSPHATIFHKWEWLKIMEKHSTKSIMGKRCKAKLYPLVVLDGETPIGAFPVFYYKRLIKVVFSPPSAVEDLYLGPLVVDYDKLKQSKRESRYLSMIREIDSFIKSELHPLSLIHI